MPRATLLPLLVLVALVAGTTSVALRPPERPAWVRSAVLRVVDGDTVVLRGLGTARIIGVDTPEVFGGVECFGPAASRYTKRRLTGRPVLVRTDAEPRDRYGRTLVHLRRPGDTLFAVELLRRGLAERLRIPPNTAFDSRLDAAAREGRARDRGLWSGCR